MDSLPRKQLKQSHQYIMSNVIKPDIFPNPSPRPVSPQIQRRVGNPSAHRAARLYWSNPDLHPTYTLASPRSLESESSSSNGSLANPLVMGSIAAGVVGVVIIAVIILGVWIRSRLLREDKLRRRDVNHVDVESTVMSSMSSGINETENVTQMDSVRLDDTTFYSAVEDSNVEFGDMSQNQNQSVYYFKSEERNVESPVETIILESESK